jgi:hypothetical protein
MSSISDTPYRDLAVKATTFATRATVAVAVPTFLFLKLDSMPTLQSPPVKLAAAAVAILSAPATFYCALGAIEAFARACGHCFKAVGGSNPGLNWDLSAKELTTAHGLTRGTLSPLSGYNIMAGEWNASKDDAGAPRLLKEEYYVYSVPRSLGYSLINAAKWTGRQLTWAFNVVVENAIWAKDQTVAGIQWCWNSTQPLRQMAWNAAVKTWDGICWAGEQTVKGIQWCWNATQPLRQLAWDGAVKAWDGVCWVKDQAVAGIKWCWKVSQPARSFVKWIVWDIVVDTVIWNFAIKTIVWKLVLKTVVWEVLLKTLIGDWIISKFIGQFLIQTILLKGIWPWVLQPALNFVSFLFTTAFNLITFAIQQAFRMWR